MHDDRGELIDEILEVTGRAQRGIWGVEVCQLCGRPGEFSGWAGAVASHRAGQFVALAHRHGSLDDVAARLAAGDVRWCEWCARPIAHQRERRLCSDCEGHGGAGELDREVRARWLRARDTAELRRIRDNYERLLFLEGSAQSREMPAVRLALRRGARRVGLRRRAREIW